MSKQIKVYYGVAAVLLVVFVFCLCFQIDVVSGESMLPTLNSGSVCLIAKGDFGIEAGDIIVVGVEGYDYPFIKRVVGMGGDTIEIKDGALYVNGEFRQEDYVYEPMQTDDLCIRVPDDSIFVLGDNRNNSIDSRSPSVGCLPTSSIVGRVVLM